MKPDYRGCRPKGILVYLKGTSTWDQMKENHVPYDLKITNETSKDLVIPYEDLYPATSYQGTFYAYNDEGKSVDRIRNEMFESPDDGKVHVTLLSIVFTTISRLVPSQVRSFERIIEEKNSGLRVKWLPPAIPRGNLQRYWIQWTENGQDKLESVSHDINQFYFWTHSPINKVSIWAENKNHNSSKINLKI